MKSDFCPNCEEITNQEVIQKQMVVTIRGEQYTIETEEYHCTVCGEDYGKMQTKNDPLEAVYRQYREKHGMLQPEEIKDFRKKVGLTQVQFSKLVGIGIATLNRYENGALQTEAHDGLLRSCMRPAVFKAMMERKGKELSEETQTKALESVEGKAGGLSLMQQILEEAADHPADIRSGYKKFDAEKFINTIRFFCYDGVLKTKLMKLLFYADFKYFKEHGVSITGARYAHATYGPVPDGFQTWISYLLEQEKDIHIEEQFNSNYACEVYKSDSPNLNVFNTTELNTLAKVKNIFEKYNASEMRDVSHKEIGWSKTIDGQIINYSHASELSI